MKCRICGSEKLRLKFTVKGYKLYKCNNCYFTGIFPLPGQEQSDNIYAADYFMPGKYHDLSTQNRENRRRLKLLTEFLPGRDVKILEVGCATGDFIEYVQDRAGHLRMWGIDYSSHAVQTAQQRLPGLKNNLRDGTLKKGDYETGFFDAVVLWDVIEHIPQPRELLSRLSEILKPGGYIFLSTPYIDALAAKIFGKYWAFMTPPEHLGFFPRRSFAYLCDNIIGGEILKWKKKGKWVNLGFLFYKMKRIFPRLIPAFLIRFFRLRHTEKLALYVPTGDILYAVIKKK